MAETKRAEPKKKVITTGDPEIDKKIGGGLPVGSLVLIEGDNDSGKSTLAQQMLWGSLYEGQRASMFTTENTVRSLITQMSSLGLEVIHFYLLGRLKINPLRLSTRGPEPIRKPGSPTLSILEYLDNLSERGRQVIQGLRSLLNLVAIEKNEVIFIDSLTGFVTQATADEVIHFFETAKLCCDRGKTIIVVIHSIHGHEPFTITRVRSICDVHLVLRVSGERGKLLKTLEVAKIRGAERVTGDVWGFEVEPKIGIRIIPIRKVQA